MFNAEWLLCPICKNKTRIKLRYDTVLNNFPLYCPKCKIETLIRVKKDDYQQSIAYIKLISIYSHHASIDELQQQVDSIQMMMETSD